MDIRIKVERDSHDDDMFRVIDNETNTILCTCYRKYYAIKFVEMLINSE